MGSQKVHLYFIVLFVRRHASLKMSKYYMIFAIEYVMELMSVNNAINTIYLWNNIEAAVVRSLLRYSTLFQTIKFACVCFLYSFVICLFFGRRPCASGQTKVPR